MLKKVVQRGRREFGRRGVQSEYVEAAERPRTKLVTFFSILLDRVLEGGFRADGSGQHALAFQFLDDAPCGFIEIFRPGEV